MLKKEEFQKESQAARKERMESAAMKTLAKMLNKDVAFFDTHYIKNRSTFLVDESLKRLKYKSDEILKARKAFLDVLVDGLKPYTFEDEVKDLKKEKMKMRKRSKEEEIAQLRIEALDRIIQNAPKDSSEDREVLCEDVCQLVAKLVLDKDNLLEEKYIEGLVELDNEIILSINAFNSVGALFEIIMDSLDRSYGLASEKLWGNPREKIRMSMLENLLKE